MSQMFFVMSHNKQRSVQEREVCKQKTIIWLKTHEKLNHMIVPVPEKKTENTRKTQSYDCPSAREKNWKHTKNSIIWLSQCQGKKTENTQKTQSYDCPSASEKKLKKKHGEGR